MLHNEIEELLPAVQDAYQRGASKARDAGWEWRISETYRDYLVQVAYFSRSRAALSEVQFAYQQAGLYNIGEAEAKVKITNALKSNHIMRKAIDMAPTTKAGKKVAGTHEEWREFAKFWIEQGFRWGGDWDGDGKTKNDGDVDEMLVDYPHFEWRF
jgi:hypothetical protein